MNKLLCVCDSPTARTGFGRVIKSLLPTWRGHFKEIDIWGINYFGWPHQLPYTIYPGGAGDWASSEKLQSLISRIVHGAYSHVWVMQDVFGLVNFNFPEVFREACARHGTRSFYYGPVDAPWDPDWSVWLDAVDVPVAYTHYGQVEMRFAWNARHRADDPAKPPASPPDIRVLPHGVDDVFRPLPNRAEIRKKWFPWWAPTDFVWLNVNANQPRKGIVNTFQLLAELKRLHTGDTGQPRLVMHMPNENHHERHHDLLKLAAQLQLVYGEDWVCTADAEKLGRQLWVQNHAQLDDAGLNELYNAADCYLTTTLGEGWGLGMIEALAAGCPAAAPDHTACRDIILHCANVGGDGDGARLCALPVSRSAVASVHDNRIRYPVDIEAAAPILQRFRTYLPPRGWKLSPGLRSWLDWGRIAREWLKLMK